MSNATTTADSDTGAGPGSPPLKRTITGLLLFFFIVGDTLGAGIYTLVGKMSENVGGVLWLPLILAMVLALLTAGTYAELITKYPHAGGAARYAEQAFKKPYLSFIVGFLMLSSGITTSAALSNAFAGDYLAALIPGAPAIPVTIGFIALLILVNLRGVRESMTANAVMTVIETTGLVIIIVIAAVVLGGGGGDITRITTFAPDVAPLQGAFAASVIAFFSFLGFEAAANMAEEVKEPSRNYPRALFGAICTAGVVYLLIALGAAIVVPLDQLAGTDAPLLQVVIASGLGVPEWLFSIIALIAIANGALLFMVMASRCTYGLGKRGLLPPVFASVLPGRRTPWVAILIVGGMTMVMSFVGDVGQLADTTVLLLLLVFISANISVLVLKKHKVDHDHFNVPRAIPVLAVIASVALLTQQQDPQSWLIAGGYVVIGTILFLIARAINKGRVEPVETVDAEQS